MQTTNQLLLVAAAAAVLTGCGRHDSAQDAVYWEQEGDRQVLLQKIELGELKLKAGNTRDEAYARAAAEAAQSSAQLDAMLQERAALAGEVADLADATQEVQEKWIAAARGKATGREFATLASRAGRTYEKVTITRVTDSGIEFRHSGGSARIAAMDLSPGEREQFGLEQESALAAHRLEQEAAREYYAAAVRAENDATASRQVAAVTPVRTTSVPRVAPTAAADDTPDKESFKSRSRLNEPAKYAGSVRRTRWRSVYYYAGPVCGYNYTYTAPRAQYLQRGRAGR